MGWESKQPYVHPHYSCRKPAWNKDFGIGSTWRCDDCKRLWRFDGQRGDQRDTYDHWTEVKPMNVSYGGLWDR